MSYKNKPLALSEIQTISGHNSIFFKELLDWINRSGKALNEIRVLDWGCGRGRYVGFLLSQGIDAYGVDIDPKVISQAKNLFDQKNWNFNTRLQVIPQNNQTNFPDGFFDFVLSDQVFEHVSDLDNLEQELYRITKKDGMQLHRWPARLRIIEPHLFMPFIHWVPKGYLRYAIIKLYVLLGIDPDWEELKTKSAEEKARAYSEYSHKKTYYRPLSIITDLFKKHWQVELFSHPILRYNKLKILDTKLNLSNNIGINILTVIMKLKK